MKNIASRIPYTFAGLTAGIVVFAIAAALDLDVFEELVSLIHKGEDYEIDELIIPFLLASIGICCDFISTTLHRSKEQEKLDMYNQMNNEMMNEISVHLTKLLEFRTALMSDAPNATDVRHELDRMILTSFNHYERAQRRGDVDSSLMSLVVPKSNAEDTNSKR